MRDHSLFLSQGLVDPDLRERALGLLRIWQSIYDNPDVGNDLIHSALQALKTLKGDILAEIEAGRFPGFFFYSFIEHMLDELNYFQQILRQGYPSYDPVGFWTHHNGSYAQLTAHLLDPSEQALIAQASRAAEQFKRLEANIEESAQPAANMLVLSLRASQDLNAKTRELAEKVATGQVFAMLTPDMILHESLENERGQETLRRMQQRGLV